MDDLEPEVKELWVAYATLNPNRTIWTFESRKAATASIYRLGQLDPDALGLFTVEKVL